VILAIDTASDIKAVALFWPKKIQEVISWQGNEIDPLEKIDQLFKLKKIILKDIKLIVINRGPGSFTGVRLGVTIANTFSYSSKIPILGFINKENVDILELVKYGFVHREKAKIQIIKPFYGRKPNINKSKKSV